MSTQDRDQALKHKSAFRQRRKAGLVVAPKPWDWLTAAEVKKIALQAYRSATYALSDPTDQTDNPRAYFVEELTQAFTVLFSGAAQDAGIAGGLAHAQHYAQCLLEGTPAHWNPQYPVYQVVTPASVISTPEVVTNADEGNVNAYDFKP
jgi:hypothetical protein